MTRKNPFACGLPRDVVLHLLSCNNKPDAKDRAKYERTDHFAALKAEAIRTYGQCKLCGRTCPPDGKGFAIHHNNYRSLFNEDVIRDVTLACNRCHGKYHRGR